MAELFGWQSFKEIVDDIMLGQGDSADPGQFMRYLNFAIKGYEDLRLHSLPAVKSVLLPISHEIRAIALPNNYLKFKSVGILNKGNFSAFAPKDSIDYTTIDCGEDQRETHNSRHGYYTIEDNRILIDADIRIQEVILNYTPTGVRTDGVTYIPRMCAAVIKAFVEWHVALRDKTTAQDKLLFKQQYMEELNKFIGLQYDVDALWIEYENHLKFNLQY